MKEKADNILIDEIVGLDADENVKATTREELRSGKLDETMIKNPKYKASLDGILFTKINQSNTKINQLILYLLLLDASPTIKDIR